MDYSETKQFMESRFGLEGGDAFEIDGISMTLGECAEGGVALTAELGSLPEGAEAALREMLEANHAFQGTGGATLGLEADQEADGGNGARVRLSRFAWPEDEEEFLVTLASFAATAGEWRAKIAAAGDGGGGGDGDYGGDRSGAPDSTMLFGMMV